MEKRFKIGFARWFRKWTTDYSIDTIRDEVIIMDYLTGQVKTVPLSIRGNKALEDFKLEAKFIYDCYVDFGGDVIRNVNN